MTVPVPLTGATLEQIRAFANALNPNIGPSFGQDVVALCEALRIAVEGLEHYDHAFGSGVNARDALAAVRELVDLGEKP